MKRTNIYKKLIKRAKGKIRSARIPRTLSKKNNNVFSNEKHLIMYTLMQKEKKHYRDMPDFLDLLKKEIGLRRIPHYTTINKFALRAKPLWFEQLITEIIKDFETEEALMAAIDGTGLSLNNSSSYYETITGKKKKFMQLNSCFENKNKLIVSCRVHRKRRHENRDFKVLTKKARKQLKLNIFLADKAYDSEDNHKFVRYELGSNLIVPLKRHGKKISGFYRKQMINLPSVYNKRASICESGFSSLKRVYGDVIYAKKFVSQKNEALCKAWTYDLVKSVNLYFKEIYFLQSLKC